MLVLIETFYSDSNFDDIRLYEKLVKCSTRFSRNITYLISQNINIHGMLPIHSSQCPGFGGFLCVASLEPIKSYKYSFLTHILVPMVMLLFNHQNHKQWLKSHFPYTVHLSIMLLERPPHIHPRSHNLAWFIKPFFVMHGFFS